MVFESYQLNISFWEWSMTCLSFHSLPKLHFLLYIVCTLQSAFNEMVRHAWLFIQTFLPCRFIYWWLYSTMIKHCTGISVSLVVLYATSVCLNHVGEYSSVIVFQYFSVEEPHWQDCTTCANFWIYQESWHLA